MHYVIENLKRVQYFLWRNFLLCLFANLGHGPKCFHLSFFFTPAAPIDSDEVI